MSELITILNNLQQKGLETRDYQVELAEKSLNNSSNIIIHLPWGSGKTIVALLIMAHYKQLHPDEKPVFLYTSGGAGGGDRCGQARKMAVDFGFNDVLGYLLDPKSVPFKMKKRAYRSADVIFAPVVSFVNDMVKGFVPEDVLSRLRLVIIDEVIDISARGLENVYRPNRHFNDLLKFVQENKIKVVGLTASIDKERLEYVRQLLGNAKILTSSLSTVFEYQREIVPVKDDFIQLVDEATGHLMADLARRINKTLGSKFSLEEILKLMYGNIIQRLESSNTIKIRGETYYIENREALIAFFSMLHKINHIRLLALESTPHELIKYVNSESSIILLEDGILAIEYFDPAYSMSENAQGDEDSRCASCGNDLGTTFLRVLLFEINEEGGFEKSGIFCTFCGEQFVEDQYHFQHVMQNVKENLKGFSTWYLYNPEWIRLQWAANQRFKRTTLAGKSLKAMSIIKKLLEEGKQQIVVITRYRALASQMHETLRANGYENVSLLTGEIPLATRKIILNEFKEGKTQVLVMTPVGGKGLDLTGGDAIIHLDVTSNADEMLQRRERIRGGIEYILYYEDTSEKGKLDRILETFEAAKQIAELSDAG